MLEKKERGHWSTYSEEDGCLPVTISRRPTSTQNLISSYRTTKLRRSPNNLRERYARYCALLFTWHPGVHRSSIIAYECLRHVPDYQTCGCSPYPQPCPCWETFGWDTPPCIKERLERLVSAVSKTFADLGVDYHVVEGSLLGAVRHGGLLPWEDDVDFNIILGPDEWLEKANQICKRVAGEGFGCFVHPRDDINEAKEWMYTKVEGRRTIVIYDDEYVFGRRQGVRADITVLQAFHLGTLETVPCLIGETVVQCPKNFLDHLAQTEGCLLNPVNIECQKLFGRSSCERGDLIPSVEEAVKTLHSMGYPSLIDLLPEAKKTNFQSC
ncbi:LicD family protein [Balamuthia mandrillaris]